MNNKIFIPAAIVIIGILIAGAVIYTNNFKSPEPNQEEILSSEQAGQKLIDFINNNILQNQSTASLIETVEENGIYKVKFNVEGEELEWRITKNGNFVFPQIIDLKEYESLPEPAEETGKAAGDFSISNDEICLEDGKPIVYFFGSQTCPHCQWEHPVAQEVMAKFGDYISFHNNMDSEADMDIFQKYSTGGIPALVLGCKYYRVGSGENAGKDQEIADLTELVCDLTNNQPAEACE